MAQDTESRSLDKVIVRLPDGMRDHLKDAATDNKRSMNAEIVARLDEYEDRLSDIRWLKTEMARLRDERDFAERALRQGALSNLDEALAAALPKSLLRRIMIAAVDSDRPVIDEIIHTLDLAYPSPPPMSLDWFNEEWVARILASPENERPDLVVAANRYLEEHGDTYEVWLQKDDDGAETVALARKPFKFRPARR